MQAWLRAPIACARSQPRQWVKEVMELCTPLPFCQASLCVLLRGAWRGWGSGLKHPKGSRILKDLRTSSSFFLLEAALLGSPCSLWEGGTDQEELCYQFPCCPCYVNSYFTGCPRSCFLPTFYLLSLPQGNLSCLWETLLTCIDF